MLGLVAEMMSMFLAQETTVLTTLKPKVGPTFKSQLVE